MGAVPADFEAVDETVPADFAPVVQEAKQPGFIQRMINDTPEMAGSMIAGGAAMPFAVAAGLPTEGAGFLGVESAASGLGSMVGGIGKQIYQKATGSPDAPQSFGQAAGEAGKDFATGALAIPAAKALGAVAAPAINAAGEAFRPLESAGAQAIKDAFAKVGGKFLPSQITDNSVLDFAENFVKSTITGGQTILRFMKGQQEALGTMAGDVAKQFANVLNSTGAEDTGKSVLGALTDGQTAFKGAAKALYQKVDEATQGAVVSTLPIKKVAQDFQAELSRLVKNPADVSNVISSKASDALSIISSLKDNLDFSSAQELRTQLGSMAKDLVSGASKDSQAVRLFSSLAKTTNDTMDSAASTLGGEAKTAWNAATSFYKDGMQKFNNDIIVNLAEKMPSQLGAALQEKMAPEQVYAVKNALSKAADLTGKSYDDVLQNIKAGHWDNFMRKATDPVTGNMSGQKLLALLSDPAQARSLEALFSPAEVDSIKNLAKTASAVTAKTAAGKGGGIVGALSQVGAMKDLLWAINPASDENHRGKLAVRGLTLLFGPYALAKMMTSPAGAELLTNGIRVGTGEAFRQGSNAFGNIVSYAIRNGYLDGAGDNTSGKK